MQINCNNINTRAETKQQQQKSIYLLDQAQLTLDTTKKEKESNKLLLYVDIQYIYI